MIDDKKTNVLILFIEFDEGKAKDTLKAFKEIVAKCRRTQFTLININNLNKNDPWQFIGIDGFVQYSVGGDNTCHEFSGWDKGWIESKRNIKDQFNVVIILNDAFLNSKPVYECKSIDDELFLFLSRSKAVIGWVDTFSRVSRESMDMIFSPMRVLGFSVRSWLCTTFIMFSRPVFEDLLPLVRFNNLEKVFTERFEDGIFKPDCGLNKPYQRFLLRHQSKIWKKRYELTNKTFELFKLKTRSIINESLLGRRVSLSHIRVLDISILYSYHLLQNEHHNMPSLFSKQWLLLFIKNFEIFLNKKHLTFLLLSLISLWNKNLVIARSTIDYYLSRLKYFLHLRINRGLS